MTWRVVLGGKFRRCCCKEMAGMHSDSVSSQLSVEGYPKLKTSRQPRTRFEKAVKSTTDNFISSLKLDIFTETFPKHHEHNPKQFKLSYSQLLTNLSEFINQDNKDLLQEQEVTEKLDKLKDLYGSCSSSQPAWRPSGNPETDLRAHHNKAKKEAKEKIAKELNKQREEWALVSQTLTEKREKISSRKESLQQFLELEIKEDKEMEDCDKRLLEFEADWPK